MWRCWPSARWSTPRSGRRKLLEQDGLRTAVVNCRFVKPLDRVLLDRILDQCELVVTIEENVLCGGFGSQVALHAAARAVDGPQPRILHLGVPDVFLRQAKRQVLLERLGLSPAGIHSFVKQAVHERVNEHSVKG